MPRFEVVGIGRETGRKRVRIYEAKDEEDAIMMAASDGTVVDKKKIRILPESPPTEPQIIYAKKLGIKIPKNATKAELSRLIDKEVEEDWPANDEATQERENRKVQTIEKTGKGYKAVMLIGILMALIAIPMACEGSSEAAIFVGLSGIILYIVAKVGAWWYHG